MKPLCIYHGGCDDGFGAAWVFWRQRGVAMEFYPGRHQEDPPNVTGRDVIFVDFSYRRRVIEAMAEQAASILVLDHHKSAQEDLEPLLEDGTIVGEFDMGRSGVMLAWEHCFPDKRPPQLLYHIQDRDLWLFELPGTYEISMAVRSYRHDFEIWDRLMDDSELPRLRQDGAAIARWFEAQLEQLRSLAHREEIGGYRVPVANASWQFASDLAGRLAEGEPFAAVYWENGNGIRTYSLRSREGGIDVSEIAGQYGGGGHRNAAGFKIASETPL